MPSQEKTRKKRRVDHEPKQKYAEVSKEASQNREHHANSNLHEKNIEKTFKFVNCSTSIIVNHDDEENIELAPSSISGFEFKEDPQLLPLSYPKESQDPCMQDGECFAGVPVKIPMNINQTGHYVLFGNFCSFSCALAYINENMKTESSLRTMLLYKFARTYFGIKTIFRAAPRRIMLKKYGGVLDLEQYRNYHKCGTTIIIHEPPFVPYIMLVQTIKSAEAKKSSVLHNIKRVISSANASKNFQQNKESKEADVRDSMGKEHISSVNIANIIDEIETPEDSIN